MRNLLQCFHYRYEEHRSNHSGAVTCLGFVWTLLLPWLYHPLQIYGGIQGAVGCPKCMKADQFVPENPIHHRMLIDLLRRARPIGKSSSDEKVHQGKCVRTCACENEYQLVTEVARLFGLLLFGCIFMWYKE